MREKFPSRLWRSGPVGPCTGMLCGAVRGTGARCAMCNANRGTLAARRCQAVPGSHSWQTLCLGPRVASRARPVQYQVAVGARQRNLTHARSWNELATRCHPTCHPTWISWPRFGCFGFSPRANPKPCPSGTRARTSTPYFILSLAAALEISTGQRDRVRGRGAGRGACSCTSATSSAGGGSGGVSGLVA